jgi:DNA (cytosine-5)-methyltransferase 1
MTAYYNEIDPAAAAVLEQLIADGVIASGLVDRRSIADVEPDDLRGFTQCHFFAGGGLWSVAARLAGWPDDKLLWTGSCPCQPFSVAGKGAGIDDVRHLWPDFFRLIDARRPAVVMGEQVAGKAGRDWFHGVRTDLEGSGYAGRAVDVPALSVDAPHIRQRLYWLAVADAKSIGQRPRPDESGQDIGSRIELAGSEPGRNAFDGAPPRALADTDRSGCAGRQEDPQRGALERDAAERADGSVADAASARRLPTSLRGICSEAQGQWPRHVESERLHGLHWSDHEWIRCHDGKARRTKPGLRLLVDGMAGRIDLWRIAGNSIVPQLAAEVLKAYLETESLTDV